MKRAPRKAKPPVFEVIEGTGTPPTYEPEFPPIDPHDMFDDDAGRLYFAPGCGYYRRAISGSWSALDMAVVARDAVTELERLREWVNTMLGYIPPRWSCLRSELDAKMWTNSALQPTDEYRAQKSNLRAIES